jgi:hypothetical protein
MRLLGNILAVDPLPNFSDLPLAGARPESSKGTAARPLTISTRLRLFVVDRRRGECAPHVRKLAHDLGISCAEGAECQSNRAAPPN